MMYLLLKKNTSYSFLSDANANTVHLAVRYCFIMFI